MNPAMDVIPARMRHRAGAWLSRLSAHLDAAGGRRRALFALALLTGVAALLYAPALHAPWYLDDNGAILQNPRLREPALTLSDLVFRRGLVILTFALNYRLGGFDPFGYHLVNLALHIGCAWLVWLLLRPVVGNDPLAALLGALLFLVHPLQTQAVNYIVQRMTLLSAGCFLLALWLFARARGRLAGGAGFFTAAHLAPYLGALLAGLAALLCKENAALLPLALYLFVVFFLPPAADRKRLLLSLLPFAVAPLLFVVARLLVPLAGGATLIEITRTTDLLRSQQLSPLRYLVTECSVLWVYIRLLFVPFGQALDHAYPVATSLFALRHLVAGAGLALLGALAWRLRRRQPLIAAGIGWFFLTLAVESSFIPLDPLFEHRLYLPLFGFVLVVLGLLRLLPGRTGLAVLALAILLCLPLSWQRNRLWADPVALFSANVASAPHSVRALTELGNLHLNAGRLAEAEPPLLRALQIDPAYLPAIITLAAVYNDGNRLREGIALARRGLEQHPRSDQLRTYLGALHFNAGELEAALQAFDQVLATHPNYAPARDYRARTLAALGLRPEAAGALRSAPPRN